MEIDFDDEPEGPQQSFLRRYRIAIVVTGVVLAGIVVLAKFAIGSGGRSKRDSITLVSLAPPPPPPPMVKPPPPPPDDQKMEQPMIKEEQPEEAPPQNEPLSTGIKGDGANSFGLSNKPGSGLIGGDRRKGTKWSGYASQVQSSVQQALQRNRKTRSANMSVNVRVWPDANGRISRAQLAGTTGDPSLDAAIRDEVLTGLQLEQPPPNDMPTPIMLRLAARRP